jgi:hypothetical protein
MSRYDDERIVGTIEAIQPKGYENPNAEAGEKDEVTPDSDSPVMLVMKMGKGGATAKGEKSGSEPETE